MSEYWVAHKKYFCKYCNIYIADDAPSKTQHEGGLRHKGNVERFVRNLYKTGEKRKHDLEEEKREMARVEKAAQAAFAQDVGAGLVKPGSSHQAPAAAEAGPSQPARKSDAFADYTTAASLGYVDPDEERYKAEQERRSKEGVVGAWEFVAPSEPAPVAKVEGAAEDQKPTAADLEEGPSRKREAEAEAPVDEEDARQFKLRKKKLEAGLGEIYDPGLIPIKLKKKEEPTSDAAPNDTTLSATSSTGGPSNGSALPKWSSRGWARPGESNRAEPHEPPAPSEPSPEDVPAPSAPPAEAKAESHSSTPVKLEDVAKVKSETPEPTLPSTTGLFKKRKVPAGGGASRGRRM